MRGLYLSDLFTVAKKRKIKDPQPRPAPPPTKEKGPGNEVEDPPK